MSDWNGDRNRRRDAIGRGSEDEKMQSGRSLRQHAPELPDEL